VKLAFLIGLISFCRPPVTFILNLPHNFPIENLLTLQPPPVDVGTAEFYVQDKSSPKEVSLDTMKFAIFVLLVVGVLILWFLLLPSKKKGADSGSPGRRESDKRKLKGAQKRVFSQVKSLVEQGNVKGAANLLESVGMLRDAINLLEQHKYIREAAGMLLRIHRPNRAAVIYLRNGMYENAANCFELAKMPLETAKCAKEAGDLNRAALNFSKSKHFIDAAECYVEAGNYPEAVKIYIALGDEAKAAETLSALLDKTADLASLKPTEQEIQIMKKSILDGEFNKRFAILLAHNNHLVSLIADTIRRDNLKLAQELFYASISDIGPDLIAIDNFTNEQNKNLAQIFYNVTNFEYAGMVYERMAMFEKAGECFEKAEINNRAVYCYQRAGLSDKARILAAKGGDKPAEEFGSAPVNVLQNNGGGNFAIELTSKNRRHNSPAYADDDMTVILDDEIKAQKANAIPPPPAPAGLKNAQQKFAQSIPEPPPLPEFALQTPEPPPQPEHDISSHTSGNGVTPKFKLEKPSSGNKEKDRRNELAVLMQKHTFFSELDYAQISHLIDAMSLRSFVRGEVLIDFQLPSQGIFFLITGSIDYYRLENGIQKHVDRIEAPEIFGELWLIAEMHANVKIIATKDCEIFLLEREKLGAILEADPSIALNMYKQFTLKLTSRFLTHQNSLMKKAAS
jgi:tetratricopeptide (TPR) repeat protein